jgi:hypothetical protein
MAVHQLQNGFVTNKEHLSLKELFRKEENKWIKNEITKRKKKEQVTPYTAKDLQTRELRIQISTSLNMECRLMHCSFGSIVDRCTNETMICMNRNFITSG